MSPPSAASSVPVPPGSHPVFTWSDFLPVFFLFRPFPFFFLLFLLTIVASLSPHCPLPSPLHLHAITLRPCLITIHSPHWLHSTHFYLLRSVHRTWTSPTSTDHTTHYGRGGYCCRLLLTVVTPTTLPSTARSWERNTSYSHYLPTSVTHQLRGSAWATSTDAAYYA